MLRHAIVLILMLSAAVAACGCSSEAPAPARQPADTRVRELADAYLDGFFEQFPEQATYYGVPGQEARPPVGQLARPRSTRGKAQEDRWLADVRAIDPATHRVAAR